MTIGALLMSSSPQLSRSLGGLYGAEKSTFALTLAGLITELLDAGTAVVSVTHD